MHFVEVLHRPLCVCMCVHARVCALVRACVGLRKFMEGKGKLVFRGLVEEENPL